MTPRALALAIVVGVAVVACGPAASASPTASPAASTAASTAATPTAVPTPASTATPPAPTPSDAPAASVACAALPQAGLLPSDRLTGMEVLGLPGRDVVRFSFDEGSLSPAGPPSGTLDVARPPFTEASSGLPIDLDGEHALQVVFKGMSLQNDVGQPTFDGERDIRVGDASRSLRQAVIFDESEGQVGWYIGYDGSSCVSLTREGDDILLALDFGPGS